MIKPIKTHHNPSLIQLIENQLVSVAYKMVMRHLEILRRVAFCRTASLQHVTGRVLLAERPSPKQWWMHLGVIGKDRFISTWNIVCKCSGYHNGLNWPQGVSAYTEQESKLPRVLRGKMARQHPSRMS